MDIYVYINRDKNFSFNNDSCRVYDLITEKMLYMYI